MHAIGWLGIALVAMIAVGASAEDGPAPEVGNGTWTRVLDANAEARYRRMAGEEEVFTGTLEALPAPAPNTASILMRDHGYRLGDRLIAGRDIPALDALSGKRVELRGKRYDLELSGIALREIVPFAVRPADPDTR